MRKKITNASAEAAMPSKAPWEMCDTEIKGFILRVQPTGIKTYYYAYRDSAGKKQRTWIGKHGSLTATQARDAAVKHSGKVALGISVQADKKTDRAKSEHAKNSTLQAFIDQKYQPWIESERKTGKDSIRRIKTNFGHLLPLPLDNITVWNIEKWRAERTKAKKKPATINRDTTILRALLSKAVDWNVIEHNPLARLKLVKVDAHGKVRYLNAEEEKRLRSALTDREDNIIVKRDSANQWRTERGVKLLPSLNEVAYVDHLQPLVLLALNTGARRGELFNLKWENVSFSKRIMTIDGAFAKSGKTRHVPLNSEAMTVLKKWKSSTKSKNGLVFASKDGKPFDNVGSAWESLLKQAKITKFRWHDMRHDFASKLVMAGENLNTVRELLGHSDYSMTIRYAHLAPEHKAAAVEKLVSHG